MKNIPKLWWLLLLVPIVLLYCYSSRKVQIKPADKNSNEFVFVELFTSEGCSSCPAADNLLAKIQSENHANVYLLSMHVDYWDRLGWRDRYSDAEYSTRQRNYAAFFNLPSVFTPQMVANGSTQFVGSNQMKLREVLQHPAKREAGLKVTAACSNGVCNISYQLASTVPVLLHFAIVQKAAKTSVKGGENNGRSLEHINVARSLLSVEQPKKNGPVVT